MHRRQGETLIATRRRKRRNGYQPGIFRILGLGICLLSQLCPTISAAQSFWDRTSLIDIHAGSILDQDIRRLATGGYELADGTPITFTRWYSSNWRDLSVTWMTELNRNFGVYWGVRTGERGQKYAIRPAIKLGFILLGHPSPRSTLSFSGTTVIGGWLKEGTCRADYGAIGGVQTVNCRLAASVLPPAETLQYLVDLPPPDRLMLSVRYVFRF